MSSGKNVFDSQLLFYPYVIQKKIKRAEARNQRLIREQNRLRFAVTEKEAAVKRLRKTLRDKSVRPPGYNGEDSCEQVKSACEHASQHRSSDAHNLPP